MFFFFLIADCSWFSSVRDQTALDEEEPSRSSIFTLCFHRDMASEKKMVLNDSVPVSLLTVRMIMQGKVSCLGFFSSFKKKKLCCIISTHTHKPDRCQASIVACDTAILAFMIWNKQTSCFKFFLQYHTAIIFAALYRKPVYVCRFCTGGSDTEWYKAFILLWYLSP